MKDMMCRVQIWTSGASWILKHFQVNLHVSEAPSHAKSQLLSALADEKDLRGLKVHESATVRLR